MQTPVRPVPRALSLVAVAALCSLAACGVAELSRASAQRAAQTDPGADRGCGEKTGRRDAGQERSKDERWCEPDGGEHHSRECAGRHRHCGHHRHAHHQTDCLDGGRSRHCTPHGDDDDKDDDDDEHEEGEGSGCDGGVAPGPVDAGGSGVPDSGINLCGLVFDAGVLTGAGAACQQGSTCFSGLCEVGLCQAGIQGAPCENGGDCIAESCSAGCACAAGGPVGPGFSCTVNNQCLSHGCTNGVCDPSARGAACRTISDCAPALVCVFGICQ